MEKFKIKVDKKLWEVITGQIVVQRRTSLPTLTISTGALGHFNRAAQKQVLGEATNLTFYKLKNGMILVEFGKEGAFKLTKTQDLAREINSVSFSATKLKKYIFNELTNQKLIYHFYLHPTDRNGLFILKELTNSWE